MEQPVNEQELKIVFAGTPDFSAEHLQALIDAGYDICGVLTQSDKPSGRGRKVIQSQVKQLALQYHIPVYQPKTLKSESIQNSLKSLEPDLMIVVAYGMILPQEVLDIPLLGCINVHFSLLPRWRGAAPIIYSILSGDQETGVTVMQMDAKMDTGDILLKSKYTIEGNETAEILQQRLTKLGVRALLNILEQLLKDELKPEAQDDSSATYTHKVSKADAKLDWTKPATKLHREVLAYNPWPIAYTSIAEQTVRIHQAIPLNTYSSESPGKIIQISADGLDVATGDGVLRIKAMQFPGKKVLSITDILNSKKGFFAVHDCFE